jgi:transcription elongation factor Elf1
MGINRGTNKAPSSPALTTFAFCDSRAIRLATNLPCPRCGTELKASDVGADRCGPVVIVCGACDYNILTVS